MWSWGKTKPAEPSAAQRNANRLARLSFAKGVGAPSSRASTRSSSEPVGSMAQLAESPAGSNDEGDMEVGSLAASSRGASSRGASSTGSAPVLNMYRSPAAFGRKGTMKQARNAAARAEAAKAEANAAALAIVGAAVVANAAGANAAVAAGANAGVAAGANAAGTAAGANAGSMAAIGGRTRRRNKRKTYRRR